MAFIKGADISMAKALEAQGAAYYLDGRRQDLFQILSRCGVNMVRLRLWCDPYDAEGRPYGGGMNDLPTVVELARRAADCGMGFLLDFHYSDFWADPSKQIKPKAWARLSGEALCTAVYLHTRDSLKQLKNRGLSPAMVQIGNEITNGLLWPDGHIAKPQGMAELLRAGISAVRELCPEAKIMLHLDYGTDRALYTRWFDSIAPYALDFDVIGMSYYPHWNGSIESLRENMDYAARRYNKEIVIAETSIGYTTDTLGCKGLVFTEEQEKNSGYPATPEGQARFLGELGAAIRQVDGGRGLGFFYWEAAWLPIPQCTWSEPGGIIYMKDKAEAGNSMANQSLFDRCGNANPALLAFGEI